MTCFATTTSKVNL